MVVTVRCKPCKCSMRLAMKVVDPPSSCAVCSCDVVPHPHDWVMAESFGWPGVALPTRRGPLDGTGLLEVQGHTSFCPSCEAPLREERYSKSSEPQQQPQHPMTRRKKSRYGSSTGSHTSLNEDNTSSGIVSGNYRHGTRCTVDE